MPVDIHFTVTRPALALGLQDDEIPKVVEACPGNGTRYLLVLTPVPNSDAARLLGAEVRSVIVSLWPGTPQSTCAVFRTHAYLAPSYVAEKLRVNDIDAAALATILGELLGRPHPETFDRPHPGTESR